MPERAVAGREVHYRVVGQGPAVIALHCSSSHSGQWKPFIAAMEGRFRVIAPDLAGYGRSDRLPDDGRSWIAHDAEMVRAFLDDTGPAHLVGHSLGGMAALAAALGRDDVLSLTMIEPVLFNLLGETGHPEAGDTLAPAGAVREALENGVPERGAAAFVEYWSGTGAWAALDEGPRAYVTATIGRVHAEFALTVPWSGAPTLADAATLACPVHLIRGGSSRASARAITGLLADAISGARLTEVPGLAHMGAVTHPGRINPIIAAYLDAVSQDRRGRE